MVCPYCTTRNTPNSIICTHCGVILKDAKVTKRPVERNLRGFFARALTYIIVGLATGTFAFILSKKLSDGNHKIELISGGIAVLVGILIVFVVSAGRVFGLTLYYRYRMNKAVSLAKSRHAHAVKRIEESLKKEPTPEAHMELGIAHLLDGENDQCLQQFDQAMHMGMRSAEFNNDYGIALARKGSLDVALDKFARAADMDLNETAPKLNLVNALVKTRDKNRIPDAVGIIKSVARTADSDPMVTARQSVAVLESGDIAGAQKLIDKLAEKGGKEYQATASNLLGVTYLKENKLKEASDCFRQALNADPGYAHAMANQGVVLMKQLKTLNAVERLKTAVDVDPDAAVARCDYGCALILDNSLNEGIREIREATVRDPLLLEAHFNLGKVYADNSIYTHAERYFTTCLKINPRLWQAAAGMGLIHYFVGPVERAVAWYLEAEKIAPDQPIVLGGLALCCALQNNYYDAERYFRKAIELDPRDAPSLANFGWLLLNRQDVETAAKFIERAITHNRMMPSALNNMALCNIEMGANDLALKNFKKALEINPDMVQVHYNLGHVYLLDKDMTSVMKEWDLAAKLEPNLADVHANLGVAYYREKKYDLAVPSFRRAVTIRTDKMEFFANYGLALSRCERHIEAIEQFDKALEIEPRSPMLHSNRGLACYFAKKVEEAMAEWRAVAQINAEYARSRGKRQQTEFDEASMEFLPLYISERTVHAVPSSSDFMHAALTGYGIDTWIPVISDEDLKPIPELKFEQAKLQRALRSLKI